jgi:hypothetical protein
MKKMFWFAISLSSAFIIFCLVAFLCIFLSNFVNRTDTAPKNTPSTENVNAETVSVAVIFHDNDKTLVCDLEITPKLEKVTSNSVETDNNIILNEGLYPFIDKCLNENSHNTEKYILFDAKNLREITDISKGIVYNYNLEGETLLTGNQLVQRLDKNLFESACRQIVFETFSGDLEKIFQFITENTVNNLSYPAVYSAYY